MIHRRQPLPSPSLPNKGRNRCSQQLLLSTLLLMSLLLNSILWIGNLQETLTTNWEEISPQFQSLRTSWTEMSASTVTDNGRRLLEMNTKKPNNKNLLDDLWRTGTTTGSGSKKCLDVTTQKYFDTNELQTKIEENIQFHQRGGNLKSIQNFLDTAMDTTLDKLQLQFHPTNDVTEKAKKPIRYLRRYYKNHPTERMGYGEALPGTWSTSSNNNEQQQENKEGTSNHNNHVLYDNRWFDVIEPRKFHDKWDASLGPIGPNCQNMVQLGGNDSTNDDGSTKYMCLPDDHDEDEKEKEACHVISVGGNDNWKFEEAIHKELGCITHTFDCTLPDDGQPKNKPENNDDIRFYNFCLDSETREDVEFGRKYLSYADALQLAGITTPPTYLKIDVEGYEYDIFTQMMDLPDNILPQQIQVELHWATRMTGLSWMPRTRSAGEITLLTGMLFNTGGYIPIRTDFNGHCTSCMEVLYFRAAAATNCPVESGSTVDEA